MNSGKDYGGGEALSAQVSQRGPRFREVRAAREAARGRRREVVTPAVVLAELYRGPGHNQVVDASPSRDTGITVRDTARADSADMVDAHVVASAVESGGGVILTGDNDDLERLASSYPNVHISAI